MYFRGWVHGGAAGRPDSVQISGGGLHSPPPGGAGRGRQVDEHGTEVPFPDGAFYMMLPVDSDDQAWCEGAIEEAHVATVPGSAFGTPGYARLSYAASEKRLREGVDRLADAGYL